MNTAAVSIGKRFKEAREKKDLTIEQIRKQTKIHSTVLIAIEEGRISEILTDTYTRSFLKKYAQILGLPANEILKEYFPPHQEPAALNIPFDENPLPREMKAEPKVLYFTGKVILIIALLLIAVFIGSRLIVSFNRFKVSKQQKQIAVFAKKKQSKTAKPAQKKKTAVKADSGSKDIIPKSTQLSLIMKVKEPVLVKLTKDGVLMFARVLSKDLIETITANESIDLEIGNAQALDLTLNGRSISMPSKNNIFTLVITRKGVRLKQG